MPVQAQLSDRSLGLSGEALVKPSMESTVQGSTLKHPSTIPALSCSPLPGRGPLMPRYFIDLHDGSNFAPDKIGFDEPALRI